MSKNNLAYVHDMLAKMDGQLDELREVSVRHDEQLKVHIKRSDENERAVKILQKNLNMAQGVGAFIAMLALIATIYEAVK